jgi:hypothetical protein
MIMKPKCVCFIVLSLQLKHRTEEWKIGASMKNMKKFGVSEKKKSLESLEIEDSLLLFVKRCWLKRPWGIFVW